MSDTPLPNATLEGIYYIENIKVSAKTEVLIILAILLVFVVAALLYCLREEKIKREPAPESSPLVAE